MALTLHDYEAVKDGKRTAPKMYDKFRVDIPEGSKGDWTVKKIEIALDLMNLRSMRDGRGCYPGIYTQLIHADRGIIMSDTTAEIDDHLDAYCAAREYGGRVLIHGLGLGSFLKGVLSLENVASVDVVEVDQDVIDLIGPHYKDSRLTIHHGDCFTKKWPPGVRWSVVWHDIWDTLCGDNEPEFTKLKRSFGRRCDWQGCWGEALLKSR